MPVCYSLVGITTSPIFVTHKISEFHRETNTKHTNYDGVEVNCASNFI